MEVFELHGYEVGGGEEEEKEQQRAARRGVHEVRMRKKKERGQKEKETRLKIVLE